MEGPTIVELMVIHTMCTAVVINATGSTAFVTSLPVSSTLSTTSFPFKNLCFLCSARTLHNIDRMVGVMHTEVSWIEPWPAYDGYGWQFYVGYIELDLLHGSLMVLVLI